LVLKLKKDWTFHLFKSRLSLPLYWNISSCCNIYAEELYLSFWDVWDDYYCWHILIGKYKYHLLKFLILTKLKLIFNTWDKVRSKEIEILTAKFPPLKSALKFSELNPNFYFHLTPLRNLKGEWLNLCLKFVSKATSPIWMYILRQHS
jgi:hypothetical protein